MGGHVEYCVTFGFSETNQRCVWKRFSEFETLHKELCKNYPIVQKIKGFPKKTGTLFMTRLHASLGDGSTFPPFIFFHFFLSFSGMSTASQASINRERCSKFDHFMKVVDRFLNHRTFLDDVNCDRQ